MQNMCIFVFCSSYLHRFIHLFILKSKQHGWYHCNTHLRSISGLVRRPNLQRKWARFIGQYHSRNYRWFCRILGSRFTRCKSGFGLSWLYLDRCDWRCSIIVYHQSYFWKALIKISLGVNYTDTYHTLCDCSLNVP